MGETLNFHVACAASICENVVLDRGKISTSVPHCMVLIVVSILMEVHVATTVH